MNGPSSLEDWVVCKSLPFRVDGQIKPKGVFLVAFNADMLSFSVVFMEKSRRKSDVTCSKYVI